VSPLQQQRPLVGDGTRLGEVWWVGDKFCFVPAEAHHVIPAEAKRRAGTPMDFAAQDPGSANAVRDDSLRTEGVFVAPTPKSLIPANFTQRFGIGTADGDLGIVGEGKDGFAVAAFDVFHSTSGHPPGAMDLCAFNAVQFTNRIA
jgi:hypothetical protein